MIKLENIEVVGWEAAIRGMRNPMNSWDKSDSTFSKHICSNTVCWTDISLNELPPCNIPEEVHVDNWTGLFYNIGHNDLELMMKLRNAGADHRKFMRMIVVYLDITAPLYWWKEFDTYKVGTVANSCSTMHKIHEKEFTLDDFSHEHLIKGSIAVLEDTINELNEYRAWYLKWDYMSENDKANFDPGITCKKDLWWKMIQLLPSSYNQRRTVMLSYEVLANIYKSRKNHKLDEWVDFCKWIESLPYSELITGASLKDIPICNEIMEEAKSRVTNEED